MLARAKDLQENFGIYELRNKYPHEVSGGEKQRCACARAISNKPALVLADEPTGNLDPANAHGVQELLFSMADKHHKTLIIVTHDQGIAANTDLCYRLEQGKLHLL